MIRLFILFAFCLVMGGVSAQHQSDFWMEVAPDQSQLPTDLTPVAAPDNASMYWMDINHIRQTLKSAPNEFSAARQQTILPLPMPDGTTELFSLSYSPVMEPGLAAKFPMIRSYSARSIHHPGVTARLVASDLGLNVSILTPKGTVYISPYSMEASTGYHVSYYTKDTPQGERVRCGVHEDHYIDHNHDPLAGITLDDEFIARTRGAGEPVDFRVYRFAVAATSDFSRMFGNTPATVLAAITSSVNRLNQIFERESAVRLNLIDGLENVIFIGPGSDPYNDIETGTALLNENTTILNGEFGSSAYDVGHVYTGRCNDVGGVARLASVCGDVKGNGVTCWRNNNIEQMTTQIAAHEVGHQFAATHSWNNCPPSEDARTGSTAYEPGSGSTIMSYAGLCNNQNTVFDADDYFHVANLQQIKNFVVNGNGNTCANTTPNVNTAPDITLNYTNGFSIPIGTPFRLEAAGFDMDGDDVTYCWEQYDIGPVADITIPNNSVTSTLFRSFEPTTSPERVFPRWQIIVTNGNSNSERLPIVSRDLNFRCTVRDNNENGGGTVWEGVSFKSNINAGPFLVSQPNSTLIWKVGEEREITWDVANTDRSPVNCQRVNIKLSTDGGFTYPVTLAENVVNDGSHMVIIPNEPTFNARVMVEAADNIFFDISNFDFVIQQATDPGLFFAVTPLSQNVCLPNDPVVDVELASLAGFDETTTLSISGLPDGAEATWSSNPALPSEGTSVTIDMSEVTESGVFDLVFTATADGIDPVSRTISLNLISDDFSALVPTSPNNGATGVSQLPTFTWVDVPNADRYILEIATSADFNPGSIIETTDELTGNTFNLGAPLMESTNYYWRLIPINVCNTDEVSASFAFQTQTVTCLEFTNEDDINISSAGLPVVESTIEVPNGVLSDVNVLNVDLVHDRVRDVKGELVSPRGTRVLLFEEPCGGTRDIDVGFDDDASNSIVCPPTGGNSFQPLEPLANFNDENGQGTWRFVVSVTDGFGNGGFIDSWTLQTCGNLTLDPPFLVRNDTLGVPPGQGNTISNSLLLAEDANNSADELTFTLINPPKHGVVRFQGDLSAAGAWSQANINDRRLSYKHDGSDTEFDSFVFSVSDGEGGWLLDTMNIKIDSDFTSSVSQLEAKEYLHIYPVPANEQLTVRILQPFAESVDLALYDIQGRQLQVHRISGGQNAIQLPTGNLVTGMYFLQVVTREGIISQKVSVAH